MKITSTKNPHVKNVVKLRNSHHRKQQGKFLIEGARCIGRGVEAGFVVEELFICPDLLAGRHADLIARLTNAGARCYELPEKVFEAIAYRRNPEGLVAVAAMRPLTLAKLPVVRTGLYVIAESLEKPGNLGAICRSADAVGADGVILCDKRVDPYNPNAVRASTGTVLTVPLAEATVAEAAAWVRAAGVALVAATPEGGRLYTDVDLTGPVALVVGGEHDGLSDAMTAEADIRISIPMRGAADSLNVASTATILLFEAARQRS